MATSASKLNTTNNGFVKTTGGDGTLSIGTVGINDLSDVKIEGNSIYLGNEPSSTSYVSGGNADDNVGFGSDALSSTTIGYKNVAVGNGALNALTTGHGNMAVGYNSLNRLVDGTGNVAVGRQSLTNVTNGIRNVAIGRQSGVNVDDTDLPGGADLTTGDNNVYIGAHTQPSGADAQNETVIGYGTTGKGNNTVTLGNSTVETSGAVYAGENGEANIYAKGLTRATDADAEDLTISLTGANDASLLLSSSGTGADAVSIEATAGGVDILASGAAAGEDIDIVATGSSVNISSTETVSDAIKLNASTGSGGIDINAGTGGIDIDAGTGGVTIDAGGVSIDAAAASNLTTSSGALTLDGAGGVNVGTSTSGVAVSIGHTTSETTVNDNLTVTGDISGSGSIAGFSANLKDITAGNNFDANSDTYNLQSSDNGKVITISNGSDDNTKITIPYNLGAGFNCLIVQKADHYTKIEALSGNAVSIVNRSSEVFTAGRYAVISIINIGNDGTNDIYIVSGDTRATN